MVCDTMGCYHFDGINCAPSGTENLPFKGCRIPQGARKPFINRSNAHIDNQFSKSLMTDFEYTLEH